MQSSRSASPAPEAEGMGIADLPEAYRKTGLVSQTVEASEDSFLSIATARLGPADSRTCGRALGRTGS